MLFCRRMRPSPILKRWLAAWLAISLVAGAPGFDLSRAFAGNGKEDRPAPGPSRDRDLKLPVEGPIREAVGDEIQSVNTGADAEPAELDGRDGSPELETRREPVELDAAGRRIRYTDPAPKRAHPAPPAPDNAADAALEENGPRTVREALHDAVAQRGRGDAFDLFWPEVLGERPKPASEQLGIVHSLPHSAAYPPAAYWRGTILAAPQSVPYAEGEVHDADFIARERADNARFAGTVVLDVNYTLEDEGKLRPGVEQYLGRLREANIKIVLWTGAERWWMDRFLADHPQLVSFVDLVITRENYCRGCADHDPNLAFKDLTAPGYDWIVDDNTRLVDYARDKGFAHFKIEALDIDQPQHEDFAQAVGDVLELAQVRKLTSGPGGERLRFYDLARDRDEIRSVLGAKPVFVINRAPFKLERDKKSGVAQLIRSDGGAAPAIKGTLDAAGGGLVIAAANTLAEQALARQGKIVRLGETWVLYLDIPKDVMNRYYNGFANRWLWPVQHGEDVASEFYKDNGGFVEEMRDDFELGYRKANEQFADAIIAPQVDDERESAAIALLGPEYHGPLSIEDYHLYRLANKLRERGFKGTLEHFTHIPWPSWNFLRRLSAENRKVLASVVEGLLANDIVGFHTEEYVENFAATARELLGAEVRRDSAGVTIVYRGHAAIVRAFPISVDVESLEREMESEEARTHFDRLQRLAKDRTLITDVARIDPTKGLPQSLAAYYAVLAQDWAPGAKARPWTLRKALRHPMRALARLVLGPPKPPLFYGLFMPSREGINEYREMQQTIIAMAESINRDFSPGKWHGIIRNQSDYEQFLSLPPEQVPFVVVQMTGASHPKVLATLAAAKVGNIVPLADGMNLVAKEYVVASANAWRLADPASRRWQRLKQNAVRWLLGAGAVLVISRTIGAHSELARYVLSVNRPNSIEQRVDAMRQAIDAAYGQASAPKAQDALGHVEQYDLALWADARRSAVRDRAPPPPGR